MKHDADIEKALGLSDLVRFRTERFAPSEQSPETLRLRHFPVPKDGPPLAISRHSRDDKPDDHGMVLTVCLTQPTSYDLVKMLTGKGDVPELGIAVSVVEGPLVSLDDPDPEADEGLVLTIYKVSFAELMHRVLHHHLHETCEHDPV